MGVEVVLVSAIILFSSSISFAQVPVPPLNARATDLTGTLSLGQRESLEQTLKAFEEKKGSQIAVLIVPTTKPEEIEQYGIRVAEAWKLGRKGIDDGVLFLVAKNDRKMRIEVGRGLEGAVPDAVAKRIIAEIVTPRFKQGDFEGGIREGVERLVKVIEGEPLPLPRRVSAPTGPRSRSGLPDRGGGAGPGWLFWAVFLIPVLLVGASIARALLGRFAGSLAAGGLGGVIVGLIAGSCLLGLLAGVVAGLFALASRGGAAFPGGGWSSGSGWSGGSSCGGGGSDFGGGGGDFGGGGASGSW